MTGKNLVNVQPNGFPYLEIGEDVGGHPKLLFKNELDSKRQEKANLAGDMEKSPMSLGVKNIKV